MAVAFRSASAEVLANVTTNAISAPSGLADGDFVLSIVAQDYGTYASLTHDAQFTNTIGATPASGDNRNMLKVASQFASSEGGTYTSGHHVDATGAGHAVLAFTGVDTGTPVATGGSFTNHALGAVITIPSLTLPEDITDGMQVAVVWGSYDGTVPSSQRTGTFSAGDERVDDQSTTGGGWYGHLTVATRPITGAASSTTGTFTMTVTTAYNWDSTNGVQLATFILRPAAGGGGGGSAQGSWGAIRRI